MGYDREMFHNYFMGERAVADAAQQKKRGSSTSLFPFFPSFFSSSFPSYFSSPSLYVPKKYWRGSILFTMVGGRGGARAHLAPLLNPPLREEVGFIVISTKYLQRFHRKYFIAQFTLASFFTIHINSLRQPCLSQLTTAFNSDDFSQFIDEPNT